MKTGFYLAMVFILFVGITHAQSSYYVGDTICSGPDMFDLPLYKNGVLQNEAKRHDDRFKAVFFTIYHGKPIVVIFDLDSNVHSVFVHLTNGYVSDSLVSIDYQPKRTSWSQTIFLLPDELVKKIQNINIDKIEYKAYSSETKTWDAMVLLNDMHCPGNPFGCASEAGPVLKKDWNIAFNYYLKDLY